MTSPRFTTDGGGRRPPTGGGGLNRPFNGRTFGSADAAERQLNPPKARVPHAGDDAPWEVGTIGEPGSRVYDMGAVLFDVLNLPGTASAGPDGEWGTPDDTDGLGPETVFTWTVEEGGRQGRTTQMTMAGALSWLRNLSVNNRDEYNYIARLLVESGYLGEGEVRYGAYTNDVAAAFLQSVIDVYFINQDEGAGAMTTWFNHVDNLIADAEASGTGADGGGGGGREALPPTRVDQFTDPEIAREAIKQAATNALGRNLTDEEAAAFLDEFRGLESQFNDERHAAELAQFQGQDTTAPNAPNVALSAQDFIDEEHGQEADAQAFGSYMGVLRRMVGLGGGGIGGNIA